jgi:hypothetical protein
MNRHRLQCVHSTCPAESCSPSWGASLRVLASLSRPRLLKLLHGGVDRKETALLGEPFQYSVQSSTIFLKKRSASGKTKRARYELENQSPEGNATTSDISA